MYIVNYIAVSIVALWAFAWEGLALWKAAKFEQKTWFVIMFLLFSVTAFSSLVLIIWVLNVVYLFFYAKKKLKLKDLKFWKKP